MRYLNLLSIFRKTIDGVVICRPRGGLNDLLCRIEECWSYAERHGRHLLIDTRRSGLRDDFGRYFLPRKEGRVSFGDFDAARWNGSVQPECLAGRVNVYSASWSAEAGNFVDTESQKPVTFDFSRNHAEQILVHEQVGGGKLSIQALQRLRLTSTVAAIVASRLRRFGDYAAVHVRNTDYKTDYVPLFQEVAASAPEGVIVLCTDDWHCQVVAREIFGERVCMSSDIPRTDGRRLHGNPALDSYPTNLDAITDLFVLAMGKRLFTSKHAGGYTSGYARLARRLRKRRDILYGLLGEKI